MTAMMMNTSSNHNNNPRGRFIPESLREMKRESVGRKFNIGSLAANCPTASTLEGGKGPAGTTSEHNQNNKLDSGSLHHSSQQVNQALPSDPQAAVEAAAAASASAAGGGGGLMRFLPKKMTEAVSSSMARGSTTGGGGGRGMLLKRQASYLDVSAEVPQRHRSTSPTMRTHPSAGSSASAAIASASDHKGQPAPAGGPAKMRHSSSLVDLKSRLNSSTAAPSTNTKSSNTAERRSSDAMGAAMIGMAMSLSKSSTSPSPPGAGGKNLRRSFSLDANAASNMKKQLDRRKSIRDLSSSAAAPPTPKKGASRDMEMAQRRSIMMKRQNSAIDLLSGTVGGNRGGSQHRTTSTTKGTAAGAGADSKYNPPPRKSSSLDSAGMDGAMGMGMSLMNLNVTMQQQQPNTMGASSSSNLGLDKASDHNPKGRNHSLVDKASSHTSPKGRNSGSGRKNSHDKGSNHRSMTPPRRISRRASLRGNGLTANDIMMSPGRRMSSRNLSKSLTPSGRRQQQRRPSLSNSIHSQNSKSKSPGRRATVAPSTPKRSLLQKSRPSLDNVDFSDDDDNNDKDDDDISIDLMTACEEPKEESSRHLSSSVRSGNGSSNKQLRRSMSSSITMPQQRRRRPSTLAAPGTPQKPRKRGAMPRIQRTRSNDAIPSFCTPRRSAPSLTLSKSAMKELQNSASDLSIDDISIDDTVAYHTVERTTTAPKGSRTPRRGGRRNTTHAGNNNSNLPSLRTHLASSDKLLSPPMINDDISIDDTVTYQLDDKKKKKPVPDSLLTPRRKIQRSKSLLDQCAPLATDRGSRRTSHSNSNSKINPADEEMERSFNRRESAAMKLLTSTPGPATSKKKMPPRSKTFDSSVLGALKTLTKPMKSFSKSGSGTSKKSDEKTLPTEDAEPTTIAPQEEEEPPKPKVNRSSEKEDTWEHLVYSPSISTSSDHSSEVAGDTNTKTKQNSTSLPKKTNSKSKSKPKTKTLSRNSLHGGTGEVVDREDANLQHDPNTKSKSESRKSTTTTESRADEDVATSPKKSNSNRSRSHSKEQSVPATPRKSRGRGRSKDPISSTTSSHKTKPSSTKSSRSKSTSNGRSCSPGRKKKSSSSSKHDHHDSKRKSCRSEKKISSSSNLEADESKRASTKGKSRSRSLDPALSKSKKDKRSSSTHKQQEVPSTPKKTTSSATTHRKRSSRSASPSKLYQTTKKTGSSDQNQVEVRNATNDHGISNGNGNGSSSSNIISRKEPSCTWACTCGANISKDCDFCGACGTRQHWTCSECQYDMNLRLFAFCSMCGTKPAVVS